MYELQHEPCFSISRCADTQAPTFSMIITIESTSHSGIFDSTLAAAYLTTALHGNQRSSVLLGGGLKCNHNHALSALDFGGRKANQNTHNMLG
jgi:hypothetical protein